MKTTVEIPDAIYRQIKARAALKGQTVKGFLLESVRDKPLERNPKGPSGWHAVFGKVPKETTEEIEKFLDEEFSRIDPDEWK